MLKMISVSLFLPILCEGKWERKMKKRNREVHIKVTFVPVFVNIMVHNEKIWRKKPWGVGKSE